MTGIFHYVGAVAMVTSNPPQTLRCGVILGILCKRAIYKDKGWKQDTDTAAERGGSTPTHWRDEFRRTNNASTHIDIMRLDVDYLT